MDRFELKSVQQFEKDTVAVFDIHTAKFTERSILQPNCRQISKTHRNVNPLAGKSAPNYIYFICVFIHLAWNHTEKALFKMKSKDSRTIKT